jgi:hypothetical protein
MVGREEQESDVALVKPLSAAPKQGAPKALRPGAMTQRFLNSEMWWFPWISNGISEPDHKYGISLPHF